MEYALVVCKRTALDNFPALISASPAFRQAITAVTKGTFDKLVLKAEGFITSGVEGMYSSFLACRSFSEIVADFFRCSRCYRCGRQEEGL